MIAVGRRRQTWLLAIVLAVVSTAVTACDDNHAETITAGALLQPSPAPVPTAGIPMGIQPQILLGQPVTTFACPTVPPLTTSLQIVVQEPRVDVFLSAVTLRFIDGTGLGGPSITFPEPQLFSTFGTTLVRAGTTRGFFFTPGFGCFPTTPIVLSATVVLKDTSGTPVQTTMTAPIH